MKKQFTILSMMLILASGLFLASCGAKRDEALVADFNAKKAEADKAGAMMDADIKVMKADHATWTAKLDSAAKMMKMPDTAAINNFKAQMKQHEDMAAKNEAMINDSIKAAENAKTDNNDQLKAAIAGLDAQMTTCKGAWQSMMDAHHKLGADITAYTGMTVPGENKNAGMPEKEHHGGKTASEKVPPPPPNTNMDESKHQAKQPVGKRGAGGTIK